MIFLLSLLNLAHAQVIPLGALDPDTESAPLPTLDRWEDVAARTGAIRADGEPDTLPWRPLSGPLTWEVSGLSSPTRVRAEPTEVPGRVAFRRGAASADGTLSWQGEPAAWATLDGEQWLAQGGDAELNRALAVLLAGPAPQVATDAGVKVLQEQRRERWTADARTLTRTWIAKTYQDEGFQNRCSCPLTSTSGTEELDRVTGPDGWPVYARQIVDKTHTTHAGGSVHESSTRREASAALWVLVAG